MEQITVQNTPSNHHEFGPSKLDMYRACPGAYKMQMGLPDTASPEAQEGTMLHECMATGKTDGLDAEQATQVEACNAMLAQVAGEGAKIYKEMPVEVKDDDGSILTAGTLDVAIVKADNTLAVIDWKFGRRAVTEVNKNMQLATYAVGAMQTLGFEACECHVFQPRIHNHSVYTFAKPEAIKANIRNIIARCKADNLLLCPCDECAYCKAKGNCPAFMARYKALAVPQPQLPEDAEGLARLYEQSLQVEKFCRDIKAAVLQYISDNGSCGPYTIKEKPGNREINNIPEAYGVLQGMVTQQEFLGLCKVSIGGLTDMLVAKMQASAQVAGQKLTKVAAKAQIEEVLAPYVTRGPATRQIVAE